jgi:hypothetical protein
MPCSADPHPTFAKRRAIGDKRDATVSRAPDLHCVGACKPSGVAVAGGVRFQQCGPSAHMRADWVSIVPRRGVSLG